jgi:hypothetical protein
MKRNKNAEPQPFKHPTEDKILKYWSQLHPIEYIEDTEELSLYEAATQALFFLDYFKVLTVQVDRPFTQKVIKDLSLALERVKEV